MSRRRNAPGPWLSGWKLSAWAAASGAYLCLSGFREPHTAGSYQGLVIWRLAAKDLFVVAPVLGSMASKFLGVAVIGDRNPRWRVPAMLGLVRPGACRRRVPRDG